MNKKIILAAVFLLFLLNPADLMAQQISLSVSPPIWEVLIQPGKEVSQTYTLSNSGGSAIVTPKIVYFEPSDENGGVNLTNKLAPDWIKYDKTSFNLNSASETNFTVTIEPRARQ